jgi:uncharacterized protein YndB with AHSA1/START domain
MVARSPDTTWSLDREIVVSRVFEAPRALVYEAWTKPEHLTKWFCPKGFSTTTHEIDARVGGRWRFDMVASEANPMKVPGGTVFDNRIVFLEMRAPELLVFDHGHDKDDDPTRFRVTVTFDEQNDKKTVVTMRQLHPTKEQRLAGIGFGAVEIGNTTIDSLADYLRKIR